MATPLVKLGRRLQAVCPSVIHHPAYRRNDGTVRDARGVLWQSVDDGPGAPRVPVLNDPATFGVYEAYIESFFGEGAALTWRPNSIPGNGRGSWGVWLPEGVRGQTSSGFLLDEEGMPVTGTIKALALVRALEYYDRESM